MQVTYAPDEPRLFWLREKPEDPNLSPHAGIKMAQVLDLLCKSMVMNVIHYTNKTQLPMNLKLVGC